VTSVSALLLFLNLWLPRFYFGTGNNCWVMTFRDMVAISEDSLVKKSYAMYIYVFSDQLENVVLHKILFLFGINISNVGCLLLL